MKDLTINLKLDNKLALAASSQFHATVKQQMAQSLSDHDVIEKAKTAYTKRENQQRIQEVARFFRTQIEQDKESADAKAKADAKAAAESASEKKRISRETAQEEARLEREYRQRVRQNAREAVADKKSEAKEIAAIQKEHDDAALSRMKALAAAGAAAAAAGLAVAKALEDRTQARSDVANEGARKTVDYSGALTELATLRGKVGETGPELAKNLGIAAQTALPLGQVASLTTRAYAGANAILDKPGKPGLMSEADYARFVTQTGKYATAMGGDAGSYGSAASMIPMLSQRRLTSEQAEGEMLRYDKFATKAGVENPGAYLDQLKQNQGFVAGGVMSGPELAALQAGMTKTSGVETAGTKTRQLVNALMSGRIRSRGMAVGDDLKDDMEKSSAYFKDLGITEGMGAIERADAISGDLSEQEANAKKSGKSFNALEYMMLHGMVNDQGRQAMLEYHGNKTMFDSEIKPIIGEQFQPGEIDRRFQHSIANNLGASQFMVNAGTQAAEVTAGLPVARLNQVKQAEYNRLVATGGANGKLDDYMKNASWLPRDFSPGGLAQYAMEKSGFAAPVDERTLRGGARDRLASQAHQLGLGGELKEFMHDTDPSRGANWNPMQSDADAAAPYDKIIKAILGAGGNPYEHQDDGKLNSTMEKLNETIQVIGRQQPAAMDGRPAQPAAAPAGVGAFW